MAHRADKKDYQLAYEDIQKPNPTDTNAHYTFGYVKKGELTRTYGVCTACMSGWTDMDVMYAYFPVSKNKERDKLFAHWIGGPKSAWFESCLKDQTLTDLDFMYEHGFIFDKLDIPANVLVNFIIGSRGRYDSPTTSIDNLWYDLVRDGIDPSLAYYLAVGLVSGTGDTRKFHPNDGGHHPLNGLSGGREAYENFVHHTIVAPSANLFQKSGKYYPTNASWGTDTNSAMAFLKEEYAGILKSEAKVKRTFGKEPVKPYYYGTPVGPLVFTYEQILTVAKKEQERLLPNAIPNPSPKKSKGLRSRG